MSAFGIVNVADFGAAGDGEVGSAAANSAAIETAMRAVSPTRRAVYFPTGIYYILRPIQIPDQTMDGQVLPYDIPLFLYGNGSQIIAAEPMSQVMVTARLAKGAPYAQAPFHLYDFTLDGNNVADECLAACTYNSYFINSYFQKAKYSGIRLTRVSGGQTLDGGTSGFLDSCHIRNNGGTGFYIESAKITDWQLRGCHIYLNKQACIYAEDSAGAQIVNCHIWNDDTIPGVNVVVLKNCWGTTIVNNIFESDVSQTRPPSPTATSLLIVGNAARAVIAGNTFFYQVIVRSENSKISFTGNSILNAGTLQAFAGTITSCGNVYDSPHPFHEGGGTIVSLGDLTS